MEIKILFIRIIIRNYIAEALYDLNCVVILAMVFNKLFLKKRYGKTKVFVVNFMDIIKALRIKAKTDPRTKLLKQYYEFLNIFS